MVSAGDRPLASDLDRPGDLGVRLPDEAADDLDARGHIGMRPAQIVELFQSVDVHTDANDVFHERLLL